jgi:RHS repeat-associated protein
VPGFAQAIAYNTKGMVSTITHANGVVFTQTPDPLGMARPGSLRAAHGAAQLWPREDYVYDGAGNIKQIGAKTYAYDASSRLISATIPAAALPYRGYEYDVFGNLNRVKIGSDPTQTSDLVYTADPATNRLAAASYDAAGNLLAYQGSTYSWDSLQQAATVNTGDETWVHLYDAAGERVWSWCPAPCTATNSNSGTNDRPRIDTFALRAPDGKVLTDFVKNGDTGAFTWEDYVYREGQLLGAAFSEGGIAHFDVDHLGSVRLETDAAGTPKYREFWPYGEVATTLPSAPSPLDTEQMKFTGHERDIGNARSIADDIDYMHARYYRPLLGRFLSPDPHKGKALAPGTWNRYAYVAGNPLRYTDPSGTVAVIAGCRVQRADLCSAGTDLLKRTLGSSFSKLSVAANGVISLKGVSAADFSKLGTYEAGLAAQISDKHTFALFVGPSPEATAGGGGQTVPTKAGGAKIFVDPGMFAAGTRMTGDVVGTDRTTLVHETGHSLTIIYPELAARLTRELALSPEVWNAGEAYPVTFENRYRREHDLPIRASYSGFGQDVLMDYTTNLVP